jgi:serine/threonine-protein kinase RsbW
VTSSDLAADSTDLSPIVHSLDNLSRRACGNPMTAELTLSMRNNLVDLSRLIEEANRFLEPFCLPARAVYLVNLALEEILTNIVKYAFDDDNEHEISVSLGMSNAEVWIECSDGGREFDPLAAPDPECGECITDCEVGGLGIHLVRKMVDSIEYHRDQCRNVLTMRVKVRPE